MAPPSRCVEAEPQSTRMRAKIPAGVHADRLQPSAEKASTRNAYAECEPLDVGGGEGGAAPQHGTLVTFYSTVSVSVRSAREGLGIVVAVGPRRRGADRGMSRCFLATVESYGWEIESGPGILLHDTIGRTRRP